MCNASGQGADRLHFMGLPQLVFEAFAFRDILVCDHHPEPVGALEAGHPCDEPPLFARAMAGVLENKLASVSRRHLAKALRHCRRILRIRTGNPIAEGEVIGADTMQGAIICVFLSKSMPRCIHA